MTITYMLLNLNTNYINIVVFQMTIAYTLLDLNTNYINIAVFQMTITYMLLNLDTIYINIVVFQMSCYYSYLTFILLDSIACYVYKAYCSCFLYFKAKLNFAKLMHILEEHTENNFFQGIQ